MLEEEKNEEEEQSAGADSAAQEFTLWPHQAECVRAVLRAMRDGSSRIGVSFPIGELDWGAGREVRELMRTLQAVARR